MQVILIIVFWTQVWLHDMCNVVGWLIAHFHARTIACYVYKIVLMQHPVAFGDLKIYRNLQDPATSQMLKPQQMS